MNVCILSGYVQEKPEVKITSSNTQVTKFDIAVPRSYKNKDGKRENDYFTLEAWGQTADLLGKYYDRSAWLTVRAEARVDKWVDQNGQKRYTTVFHVNEVFFGGNGNRTSDGNVQPTTGAEMSGYGAPPLNSIPGNFEPVGDDGDLPF